MMRRSAAPSQLGAAKRPRPNPQGPRSARSEEDVVALLQRRGAAGEAAAGGPPPGGGREGPRPPMTDRSNEDERHFSVVWGKLSKKKHKTWEGDAILVVRGRSVRLLDMDGKEIGRAGGYPMASLSSLDAGSSLVVGGKEVEVSYAVSADDFRSGRCFGSGAATPSPAPAVRRPALPGFRPVCGPPAGSAEANERRARPLYDADAEDALVLPRPPAAHMLAHNRADLPVVDVVVDPLLARLLRPHQRQGVVFLYECLLGFRGEDAGCGAILADAMGLGKTLQCIALVWTLLKQGPYGGRPVVKRCLIVTPGSLVKNWSREFSKWLGDHRLSVFYGGADARVEDYARTPTQQVLVASYEMFLRHADLLSGLGFDMLICDEGHRLKNLDSKTTAALRALPARRRVLLSGTPLQNDLQELFALADFCCPGALGSAAAFRRLFADAIVAGRQPGAGEEERAVGEARARELGRLTARFVLRRTEEVTRRFLPGKEESVLFCRPSPLQLDLYRQVLHSQAVTRCLQDALGPGGLVAGGAEHLACITRLKKLCNDPSLVWRRGEEEADQEDRELWSIFPDDYQPDSCDEIHSGKLWVVGQMLVSLMGGSAHDKMVLVSNYTKTLDVLQRLCDFLGVTCLRLDGQTPTQQRQRIVERFNDRSHPDRVLLLSSKAGGVGLNLIGAAHLLLFDVDWNPAHEVQAMARVWRDGQRRRVHVYRLLTTGSIEEKIFQRQISKQGLSGQVVDARARGITFSAQELKDLFTLHEDSACLTHDLLQCPCDGAAREEAGAEAEAQDARPGQLGGAREALGAAAGRSMAELMSWRHLAPGSPAWAEVRDPLILAAAENLSFVFQHEVGAGQATGDAPQP